MVNIFKITIHNCVLFLFLFAIIPASFAQENDTIEDEGETIIIDFNDTKKEENRSFPRILIPSNKVEEEYFETPARRFDIVFFLSLPFVFGYQFLLSQLLASNKTINGHQNGALSDHQWMYVGISSLILAFGVSYHDYIEMKQKDAFSEMSHNSGFNSNLNKPGVQAAWSFSF